MRLNSAAAILSLLATALAVPMGESDYGEAAASKVLNDRAAAPAPTPGPTPEMVKRAVKQLTITVSNKYGAPITTRHARDPSKPRAIKAVTGNLDHGVLKNGQRGIFVVPVDYIGAVFVNDAKFAPSQHCTQIELSLIQGKIGFDVSNVTGWSVPVVCKCKGGGKTYTSGCNVDLKAKGQCPNWNKADNACENPYRDNSVTRVATPFFKACQGKSYTFVHDHAALRYDLCKESQMTCCVGKSCQA